MGSAIITPEEKYLMLPIFQRLVDAQLDLLKSNSITPKDLLESVGMSIEKYRQEFLERQG